MFCAGRRRSLLQISRRMTGERLSFNVRSALQKNHKKGRCLVYCPCDCFDISERKKYIRRRSHRLFSHTLSIDDSNSKSESKSARYLWEEMAPDTRQLAISIIGENPAFSADSNIHHPDLLNMKTLLNDRIQSNMHPRVAISRAITLMESKNSFKKKQGDLLLTYLISLPPVDRIQNERNERLINSNTQTSCTPRTLRVGFAGPPGVGKSSMMEAFGMNLLNKYPELKLAVVCIDPSSNISGGSILGDKTRMTQLSRQVDRALVRPSCNSGVLGGLSAYTDDVMRLLGAAGYPLVFVETVGLGQSEIEVAHSVDVLILLVSPSGGDDLQGVKKGIVEMANILVVTKNDGDLEAAADRSAADYKSAVRVIHQSKSNNKSNPWMPPVVKTSSITECGLDDLWNVILQYEQHLLATGEWDKQRQRQSKYWMSKHFSRLIQVKIREEPRLEVKAKKLEQEMLQGLLTPRVAAQKLQDEFFYFAKKEICTRDTKI